MVDERPSMGLRGVWTRRTAVAVAVSKEIKMGIRRSSSAVLDVLSCLVLSIDLAHCGNEFRNSAPVRTLGL